MTSCIECGSTTNPIWYSDDEWVGVCVCLECVKTRHWRVIKSLAKLDILISLLLLATVGLMEPCLIWPIVGMMLVMGLITFLTFSPYPLYGENRRRYKEWKK